MFVSGEVPIPSYIWVAKTTSWYCASQTTIRQENWLRTSLNLILCHFLVFSFFKKNYFLSLWVIIFAFFCLTNACWCYIFPDMIFFCNPFACSFLPLQIFLASITCKCNPVYFWTVLIILFIYLFFTGWKEGENTPRKEHSCRTVIFLPRHVIVCSNQPQIYN